MSAAVATRFSGKPFPKHLLDVQEDLKPVAVGHHGLDTPTTTDSRDPFFLSELENAMKKSNELLLKKMAASKAGTHISLWSSGNLRIDGKDTTMRATDATILYGILKGDTRFTNTAVEFFDPEKQDWKATYVRTSTSESCETVSE